MEAKKVFDEMPHRDVIVWNFMIAGFCKTSDVDLSKVLCLFKQMSKQSVVSWNLMISCLESSGQDGQALEVFHEMQDNGFDPFLCRLKCIV